MLKLTLSTIAHGLFLVTAIFTSSAQGRAAWDWDLGCPENPYESQGGFKAREADTLTEVEGKCDTLAGGLLKLSGLTTKAKGAEQVSLRQDAESAVYGIRLPGLATAFMPALETEDRISLSVVPGPCPAPGSPAIKFKGIITQFGAGRLVTSDDQLAFVHFEIVPPPAGGTTYVLTVTHTYNLSTLGLIGRTNSAPATCSNGELTLMGTGDGAGKGILSRLADGSYTMIYTSTVGHGVVGLPNQAAPSMATLATYATSFSSFSYDHFTGQNRVRVLRLIFDPSTSTLSGTAAMGTDLNTDDNTFRVSITFNNPAADPKVFGFYTGGIRLNGGNAEPISCAPMITPDANAQVLLMCVAESPDGSGTPYNLVLAGSRANSLRYVESSLSVIKWNGISGTGTATLVNAGASTITEAIYATAPGPQFSLIYGGAGACRTGVKFSLAPGQSCKIFVGYTGSAKSTTNLDLTYKEGSRSMTLRIPVVGEQRSHAMLNCAPSALNYGLIAMRTTAYRTFTCTNSGTEPATLTGFTTTSPEYAIAGGTFPGGGTCPALGGDVAAGASCTYILGFTPPAGVAYTSRRAELGYIRTGLSNGQWNRPASTSVTLHGTGAAPFRSPWR